MEYELDFRKGGRGHRINPSGEQGKAIVEALNGLNVIRTGMYFEALGYKFQILGKENYGSYTKVSFLKTKGGKKK